MPAPLKTKPSAGVALIVNPLAPALNVMALTCVPAEMATLVIFED